VLELQTVLKDVLPVTILNFSNFTFKLESRLCSATLGLHLCWYVELSSKSRLWSV